MKFKNINIYNNIIKNILILILILFNSYFVFSLSFSTCNSTVPSGSHTLANDINDFASGGCFIFGENITFDCQGYLIDGTDAGGSDGIRIGNNNTLLNCRVKDFGTNYHFKNNGTIINSSSESAGTYGFYFNSANNNQIINSSSSEPSRTSTYIFYGNNNTFTNFQINTSSYGLRFFNAYDNIFSNITVKTVTTGVYIQDVSTGNLIENSNFTGITNIILLGSSGAYNNTFHNNYLENWSKITSDNWNNSPQFFYDNTYLAGTQLYTCFDYPYNTTCDIPYPIIEIQSNNNPISTFPVIDLNNFPYLSSFLFI
ncbi:MAG: right-handed parallel beta-helix repeat-containing protein [Nanoarchaeota archaeon]|nr:right-handed parallel beta-helix repeat-containing protein [Nanoarchaeota archaeon]